MFGPGRILTATKPKVGSRGVGRINSSQEHHLMTKPHGLRQLVA